MTQKLPRDIEVFEENGNPVIYKIQHDEQSLDTSNDFYPIHREQASYGNILRLQKNGGSFMFDSLNNEFPTLSVQYVADCFRMGKSTKQFRHLCFPLSYSPLLEDSTDATRSSISSLDTDEADCEV